jgi:hypothetical protein
MNMNEWKTKIDSASDIGCITFTLTNTERWMNGYIQGTGAQRALTPAFLSFCYWMFGRKSWWESGFNFFN